MTPKQQRFCDEYLVDLNATQAAIRAGYSQRTARAIGRENLTKPDIAARIAELQSRRERRTEVEADQVVRSLAEIAFADRRVIFDDTKTEDATGGIPDSLASSFEGVEYTKFGPKIKFASREKALELLGKHLGMFVEKVETKITEGSVTIYLPDNGRDHAVD